MNYSTSPSSIDYKSIELVYIHELCFAGVVSLWRLYKRRGPIKIYFMRATRSGLKLAKLFVLLNILQEEPKKIDNLLFMDTPNCRFWNHLAEIMNAGKKHSHEIAKIIKSIFPDRPDKLQNFWTFNIRKSWEAPLAELMHLCLLAKLEASNNNLPLKKVIILSSFTPIFIHWGLKEKFSEINLQVFFEIRFLIYNLGALFINLRSFFEYLVKFNSPLTKYDSKAKSARFGVEAAWGTNEGEGGRLDDLFWWHNSNLPGSRVAYLYQREDIHPKASEVENLKSLEIQPIVINSKLARNWPQLYFNTRQKKSFFILIRDIVQTVQLTFKSISRKTLRRRVISQVNWRCYKLGRLVFTYKLLNIKGVFCHDEAGFDDATLACKLAGGVRIGTHWSCYNGVSEVNRSHDVFFIWGNHDAKIINEAGSVSKYLIISGCMPMGNSKKIAYENAEAAAKTMRSGGVKYLVSIFDCGVPMPNFYKFFLHWLLQDPCLGLLIKPKKDEFLNKFGSALREIYDQALETGRVHLFDGDASPADASRVSDFSVGVGSISAVVVAALHGARIFYLDYEKLNQGPQKPYCTLHSLGEKRCVFYNPESLKKAVLEYIDNPETNPYLGDASPVMNEFDSFRDGKASERIGEYISWYLEGLDKNLEKDIALQDATQKYAAKWGKEKVIINIPV